MGEGEQTGGSNVTRRGFVTSASALAMSAMIVPRHVLGGPGYQAPSDTLNIACVGVGGMGMNNMSALTGENIVAVCDVDFPFVERGLWGRMHPRGGSPSPENVKLNDAYAKAKKYADFREMLAQEPNIDAVVIATPDHMHAVIANAAMKAKKHVYVQKPLTYAVAEARLLARTAKETGVVTQMGNQGHSREGTRRIKEIVESGVLGKIREVHVWTDRPVRYWAQGIPRPGTVWPTAQPQPNAAPQPPAPPPFPGAAAPPRWSVRTVENAVIKAMADASPPVPEGLHWDLFLGVAPEIPYHPAYHPFSWRGWVDFGVSAIGDMGAHLIDQPYWALGLGQPTSIVSSSTMWGGPATNPGSYPLAMTTQYEFAARGKQPPVKLFWYDSGLLPPRPSFLPDDMPLSGGDGGGGYFVGEHGILTYETYGDNPKVYPEKVAREAERVPKTITRIETSHEMNWAQACKGVGKASSPFEYAAALTETMLLGVVALRTGQGKKLLYDGPSMTVTNIPEANQWLTRKYRDGWALV
jgi:predicted dehydrogenase